MAEGWHGSVGAHGCFSRSELRLTATVRAVVLQLLPEEKLAWLKKNVLGYLLNERVFINTC